MQRNDSTLANANIFQCLKFLSEETKATTKKSVNLYSKIECLFQFQLKIEKRQSP